MDVMCLMSVDVNSGRISDVKVDGGRGRLATGTGRLRGSLE
jgi:hypothetical protein